MPDEMWGYEGQNLLGNDPGNIPSSPQQEQQYKDIGWDWGDAQGVPSDPTGLGIGASLVTGFPPYPAQLPLAPSIPTTPSIPKGPTIGSEPSLPPGVTTGRIITDSVTGKVIGTTAPNLYNNGNWTSWYGTEQARLAGATRVGTTSNGEPIYKIDPATGLPEGYNTAPSGTPEFSGKVLADLELAGLTAEGRRTSGVADWKPSAQQAQDIYNRAYAYASAPTHAPLPSSPYFNAVRDRTFPVTGQNSERTRAPGPAGSTNGTDLTPPNFGGPYDWTPSALRAWTAPQDNSRHLGITSYGSTAFAGGGPAYGASGDAVAYGAPGGGVAFSAPVGSAGSWATPIASARASNVVNPLSTYQGFAPPQGSGDWWAGPAPTTPLYPFFPPDIWEPRPGYPPVEEVPWTVATSVYQSDRGTLKFLDQDWGSVSPMDRPYIDAVLRMNHWEPTTQFGYYGPVEYRYVGQGGTPTSIHLDPATFAGVPDVVRTHLQNLFTQKGWMEA